MKEWFVYYARDGQARTKKVIAVTAVEVLRTCGIPDTEILSILKHSDIKPSAA